MNRKCEAFLAEYGLAEKQIFIFYSYLNLYSTLLAHTNTRIFSHCLSQTEYVHTYIGEMARRDEGVSRKSTDTNEEKEKKYERFCPPSTL